VPKAKRGSAAWRRAREAARQLDAERQQADTGHDPGAPLVARVVGAQESPEVGPVASVTVEAVGGAGRIGGGHGVTI
jgi:hypothetical protein